jgi:hypothetical protein
MFSRSADGKDASQQGGLLEGAEDEIDKLFDD